jgi:site-specific DNA-methyltransferase (adenine-specific)
MNEQASFTLKGRNPDVLTCIANLSNDEVFTPPEFANRMLDTLAEGWAAANNGADIWADSKVTFLDPCTKSGVFLREIATRLIKGLEAEIPDLQARVDHILTKQLFGIGITQLTALLARRSLYCSKHATGPHSVAKGFGDNDDGHVWFERTEHVREGDRCRVCGAGKAFLDRGPDEENHAYAFIHASDIKARLGELFGGTMHFDVIIGNPPYQLNDGGHGVSASPIYQKFIEQAKKLEPRFLSMVVPSRWFGGGKGLGEFRAEMLGDNRIRKLVDFENATDAFPGVDLAGGVCFFLWSRDERGLCEVVNVNGGVEEGSQDRQLGEFSTFVRHSAAVPIIRKVLAHNEPRMSHQVSSRKPIGLPTNARPLQRGDITLRWEKGDGPYERAQINVGVGLIDKWKVITSYVAYDHAGNPGKDGRRKVFSKIDVLPPGSVCTETYLVIGAYDSEEEARHLIEYMKTRFFRFLVSQFMYSHHLTRAAYEFVPALEMTSSWTDDALADRYGFTGREVGFIESKIRPFAKETAE